MLVHIWPIGRGKTKLLGESRLSKALGIILILAVLDVVFCAGCYLGQVTFVPQVVIEQQIHTIEKLKYLPVDRFIETVVYEPVEKVVEKTVYQPVEKVVEKTVYQPIEKVIIKNIEIPKQLNHFTSVNELRHWLDNISEINIGFDVVNKETGQVIKKYDCDDYAMKLQERALNDGYIMSFEVIHDEEYNTLFQKKKLPDGSIHAINSVIIDNEVYYVEPQNFEIAFVACVD